MIDLESVIKEIMFSVVHWEPILDSLSAETIMLKRNNQNRTIKQIIGHLIDSATNNTHRIVHLHYQKSPLIFPNYATNGNNDRWIAIQDYQNEDWHDLINLWKYSMLHICHVIRNVDPEKLENEWISGDDRKITMESMIVDFPKHFKLHIAEIEELINNKHLA